MKQNISFYLVPIIILLIISLIISLIIVKRRISESFYNKSIDEESELIQSESDNEKKELVMMLNNVMNENNNLKQKITSLLNQIKKNSSKLHLCNKVNTLSDYQSAYGERKHMIDKLKSGFTELIEDSKDLDDQNNDIITVHRNKQLSNSAQYGSTIPTPFV